VVGHYINRHLPSVDTLLRKVARGTVKKLDRPSRTLGALRVRGLLTLALLLPIGFLCGLALNALVAISWYSLIATTVVLVPLIGQRQGLETIIKAGQQLREKNKHPDDDLHQTVRAAGASAILGFAVKLVPRTLWWGLGGFALLLPHMILAAFISVAEKRRSGYPESPFFSTMFLLYEITTVPPSLLATALLALAHFFLPGTNLAVFKAFHPRAAFGPASRYFPLNTVATGLNLSLEAEICEQTGNHKSSDKNIHWIGPADGRAQLLPADLRKIWLISIISYGLYLLIAGMIFTVLLQNVGTR
jgi:hypothetical protein